MYCNRCKIETNDSFCENCGSPTIEITEKVESTVKKTDNKRTVEKVKIEAPKLDKKNIAKIIAIGVIAAVLLVGFNFMKAASNPQKIAENFVEYILANDYSKALGMIESTDSSFIQEKHFEKYIETLNLKGKKVVNVKSADGELGKLMMLADGFQDKQMRFFQAQVGNELFYVLLKHQGKNFFVDKWAVSLEEIVSNREIIAPKGSKVMVDGVEVTNIRESNQNWSNNTEYNPTKRIYILENLLPIDYDVEINLEGAEPITFTSSYRRMQPETIFQTNKEIEQELKKISENYLKTVYFDGEAEKQTPFFIEKYISRELQDIRIINYVIEDIEHSKIMVEVDFAYEMEREDTWFSKKKEILTGQKTDKIEMYFVKNQGKWDVVDIKTELF